MMNPGGGNDKKKTFQFVRVRPEDLEPPASLEGDSKQIEAWIQQRVQTIEHCEKRIDAAFQAQRGLVFKLVETGGIKKFQSLWKTLMESNNSRRIPSLLARAAQETSLFLHDNGFDDMLTNACAGLESAQTSDTTPSTSQWPTLSQWFPELSEWVLTPDQIVIILERECPVLLVDTTPEAKVIHQQSFALLLEHGRLCEAKEGGAMESEANNRTIGVRDTDQSPDIWKHGATRLLVLSTFVTALVEFTTKAESCAFCGRTGMKLLQCSRCHCVQYCSRDCQVGDFQKGGHKQDCRSLLDLRERYSKTRKDIPSGSAKAVENFPYPHLRDKFLGDIMDQAEKQAS